jgi:hypothetical protein
VKIIRCCLLSVSMLLSGLPLFAQTAGFYMGFGSNTVKSNGFGLSAITGNRCSPVQGDSTCLTNPDLSGFFLGFGGDAMIDKHFGIGAELSFQPSKPNYGPFQYRQMFYDFNGIYAPVNEKKVSLKLMGGFGGSRTSFSFEDQSCSVCSTTNVPVGKSNHFQLHAGAGIEIMITESLMVRPQFDFRYVPNLSDQFGRDIVTGGMVWVGFKFNNR